MRFPNNSERRRKTSKSTNGEFGCSCNTVGQPSSSLLVRGLSSPRRDRTGDIQLKESPTFLDGVRRHDINQILDSPTIEIVPMVCLYDGFKSYPSEIILQG
jgi:hypothetical protein